MRSTLDALMSMELRAGYSADLMAGEDTRARILHQIENYPAIALPNADDAAVVCGIVHARGVGEVWMVTGVKFEKYYRRIVRQHRLLIQSIMAAFNLHRVHMLVDPRVNGAARYARAVGLDYEATLHGMAADGNDIQIFCINKGRK